MCVYIFDKLVQASNCCDVSNLPLALPTLSRHTHMYPGTAPITHHKIPSCSGAAQMVCQFMRDTPAKPGSTDRTRARVGLGLILWLGLELRVGLGVRIKG